MLITKCSGENSSELRTCQETTSKTASEATSVRSNQALSSSGSSRFRQLFDAALVERGDVLLMPLCELFVEISNMMSSWNYVFQMAVVDLQKKVERIRALARDRPEKYRSMQSAAEYERATGIFMRKENGVTSLLLSLHRTMRFTIAFLDGIRRADPGVETSTVAREAYLSTVARHHNWATRKMTTTVMGSVPARREMMDSILKQDGNGVSEAEFLEGFVKRAEILRVRSDAILDKE